MNKHLPLYLQSCHYSFKVNFRPHALALFSFFLVSLTAFAQGPGCPNVFAGDDIELNSGEPCTDLTASYLDTGETTSYAVSSIPYEPPFPFTGGTPVSVNIDDRWSDAIQLPFDFCYFGETHTQMVIGSNAVISFDLVRNAPNTGCNWDFNSTVPSANLFSTTIFGPYMDVDPSVSGSGQINWTVFGEAPCRTMVVNFPGIPYYGCNELTLTSQVVIYETTNVVEVYVKDRPNNCYWNDGNAVIGIQNLNGTQGYTPEGRNTGDWAASNEAWRFTPNGDSNVVFAWLDSDGNVISNDTTINVCPTEASTTYTAQAIYTNCNGDVVTESDDVTVTRADGFSVNLGDNQEFCDTPSYVITAEIIDGNPADATFLWSTGETTQSITVTTSGTYSVAVTIGDQTINSSVDIIFNALPILDLGADIATCFSEPIVLDASPTNYNPADLTYEWSFNGVIIADENMPTLIIEEIGNYSVTATYRGCATSDSIEVTFKEDLIVTVDDDFQTCPKEAHTLTAKTRERNATFQWYLNGTLLTGETNSTLDIIIDQGTVGTQTYSVVISDSGCTGTDSVDVSLYDLTNCVITQGISPNGDGFNDSLELSWLNDRTGIVKLKIYNRWGTLVFDQRNYSNQWKGQSNNGNDLPTGTYFYVIDLKSVDAVYGGRTTGWIYLTQKVN